MTAFAAAFKSVSFSQINVVVVVVVVLNIIQAAITFNSKCICCYKLVAYKRNFLGATFGSFLDLRQVRDEPAGRGTVP